VEKRAEVEGADECRCEVDAKWDEVERA